MRRWTFHNVRSVVFHNVLVVVSCRICVVEIVWGFPRFESLPIANNRAKMVSPNPLNVFKGPNSLSSFFDPDQNPPLPLVEIPDALNPLRLDGVRIFAKMLTQLPAQNVKSLPGRCKIGLDSSEQESKQ
jgi:hypothetical protein